MKPKKRFIAGASCPQCQSQDTLRWWIENNIELVECVECDYHDQRKPQTVEKSQHAAQEMIGIFKPD
ncbi:MULTISPECIES: YheV family putative zinc ribbon protein [unclassified Vibrio]|uniref:YheV family putative zinc ribbon protein n=1 Tax=unclassified Vibrio TaxID=2614977 RepID=UPI0013619CFD|nr:YheV family putative metal-binding protein [Vibrio sp. V36_P2S2PM302]NAX19650.1 YheV family putative metal-binding protein [Vibrio sp. V39_P1S14PM300]NAX26102.1 YheV family putative metal-binding protein [Vibrio sp. V38_P2S17PM301]NAX30988.1 YheV family putative metal-binding protein [Vibrio sp. V37_P2S8PM304]